jgi:hypothetical protein
MIRSRFLTLTAVFAAFLSASPAPAREPGGKLLVTAGLSQIEGAGGGALTPWAIITGYGTKDQIGANAHLTHINSSDADLRHTGVAVGFYDRFELSLGEQRVTAGAKAVRVGLPPGLRFNQTILGFKLRVAGDAVYDQDRWLPQIAVGLMYKDAGPSPILLGQGATDDQGWDYYVAATKFLFAQSLMLNGTVRATKSNQLGLLGFGGPLNNDHELYFEGSAVYLVNRRLAVGAEYRCKPENLTVSPEDDWKDYFVAYWPSKQVSISAGYLNLGTIGLLGPQDGTYVSISTGF